MRPWVTFLVNISAWISYSALTLLGREEVYSSSCYKYRTATGTHVPYGITHSRLYTSQLRLVLDLATQDGCKAELCAGVEVCYVRLSCCQVVMDTKLISSQTRAEARRTTVGVPFRYDWPSSGWGAKYYDVYQKSSSTSFPDPIPIISIMKPLAPPLQVHHR